MYLFYDLSIILRSSKKSSKTRWNQIKTCSHFTSFTVNVCDSQTTSHSKPRGPRIWSRWATCSLSAVTGGKTQTTGKVYMSCLFVAKLCENLNVFHLFSSQLKLFLKSELGPPQIKLHWVWTSDKTREK